MELNESKKTVVVEHPLPSEIRQMNRDETVCKYCGVSYLIHNEIKALEDKLRVLEEKLAHFEGGDERESILKENIKKLEADKLNNNLSLECNNAKIKQLILDNDKKDGEIEVYMQKIKESAQSMKALQFHHNTFAEGLSKANEIIKQQKQLNKECRSYIIAEKLILDEKLKVAGKNLCDSSKYIIRDTSITKDRLAALESANCKLVTTETEQSTTIDKLQKEIAQRAQTNDQLTRLQHEKSEMDTRLKELSNKCSALFQQNEIIQSGADRYKDIINLKEKELAEMRVSLQKSSKLSEGAIIKLRREINEHMSSIDSLKSECESLKKERNKLTERIKCAADNQGIQQAECNDINEDLKRARMDLEAANQERQLSIVSHQQQIYDLRESFQRRSENSEGMELRLKSALEQERTRAAIEFRDLEARLVESAAIDARIAADKFTALASEHNKEINLAEEKVRHQLSELHSRDIRNATQKLELQHVRHEETVSVLRSELAALKAVIITLEQKLASVDLDGGESLNRKENDLRELREKHMRLETEKNLLDTKQVALIQEISFLQETVRRECEERLETTEILKALKAELLLNRQSHSIKSHNQLPQRRSSTNDSKIHLTITRNSSPRQNEEMIVYKKTQKKLESSLGHASEINVVPNGIKGSITDSRQRIAEAVARRPSPDFLKSN